MLSYELDFSVAAEVQWKIIYKICHQVVGDMEGWQLLISWTNWICTEYYVSPIPQHHRIREQTSNLGKKKENLSHGYLSI